MLSCIGNRGSLLPDFQDLHLHCEISLAEAVFSGKSSKKNIAFRKNICYQHFIVVQRLHRITLLMLFSPAAGISLCTAVFLHTYR